MAAEKLQRGNSSGLSNLDVNGCDPKLHMLKPVIHYTTAVKDVPSNGTSTKRGSQVAIDSRKSNKSMKDQKNVLTNAE